jgi:L-arabinonolactonase
MAKKTHQVKRIAAVSNVLGEGIVWHEATNSIYWLDVAPACKLFAMELSSGSIRSRKLEVNLYCLRRCVDGILIGLTKSGLAWIDPTNMTVLKTQGILDTDTRYRFNDANCDARGQIWTGTMIDNFQTIDGEAKEVDFTGQLYRIGSDGTASIVDDGYGCPNTFAWSQDEKTMYCADSVTGWIYSYDFDVRSGKIARRRRFYENKEFGIPDGSAMDTEGCLWNARWDGSAILRITPDGRLDRVIKFPVSNVTDCAFGGADLRTLFVTTARHGVSRSDLALQPLAGDVFAISVGSKGIDKGAFVRC